MSASTEMEMARSEALMALIRKEISERGPIGFSRFMELALYAPELGYYAAGNGKFGAEGDFVTSPELGSLFAQCMARAIMPVLGQTNGDILEVGAGTGAFAVDMLTALDALGVRPRAYNILEISADLRARQQARLRRDAPRLYSLVRWLQRAPTQPWQGMLFANEVLDALPVCVFSFDRGRLYEERVATGADGGFQWRRTSADPKLQAAVAHVAGLVDFPQGPYRSELSAGLAPWLREITAGLQKGAALFVDYGYPRREYYLAERDQGTLVCHYRHRAYADPFARVGLQDITAFVDFTALAEAGTDLGFELACYAPQAQFLIAAGLPGILQQSASLPTLAHAKLVAQTRRLTLPGEMGERFQCMLFTRGMDQEQLPFVGINQSYRL